MDMYPLWLLLFLLLLLLLLFYYYYYYYYYYYFIVIIVIVITNFPLRHFNSGETLLLDRPESTFSTTESFCKLFSLSDKLYVVFLAVQGITQFQKLQKESRRAFPFRDWQV